MFYTNVEQVLAEQENDKTREEKIRAMDTEDLAWLLMEFRVDAVAKADGSEAALPDTQKKIVEWLRSKE